jgi:acyl transferase domain-containing protein
VASLIKTVLALQNKELPASLNFEMPNSRIDFANSPFYVTSKLSPWEPSHGPRRAGISAFGIGGTNVHIVIEEAPKVEKSVSRRPHELLVLSARSETALEAMLSNLLEHLEHHGEIESDDLSYTYQVGRRLFNHRCAIVYQGVDDLLKALKDKDSRRLVITTAPPRERSAVFMFPGQGSQYVNMALELYQTEPAFRASFDHCAEILKESLSCDLRALVYPTRSSVEESTIKLNQTSIAQPALFVIEYALAELWREWGISPAAMIGHSIGEYVAACLAGVFSLSDALELVSERGRLMQGLPTGSMLAVPLAELELLPLLDGELDLAATNEPSLCVVSGASGAIEGLQSRLAERGVGCRRLHTSHAFHSRMMHPVLEEFTERVAAVRLNEPELPYISNVTGDWIKASEATSPEYWARQLRRPVRFVEGMRVLLSDQDQIFIEVGPGSTLSTLVRRHPDRCAGHVVVSSLRHPQERHPDTAFLLTSLARLWLSGAHVNWSGFHSHEKRRLIHLPVYPFERQRYWAQAPESAETGPAVILKEPDIADWFYVPSWEYSISPDPEQGLALGKASRWLVFQDDQGVGLQVADRLQQVCHDVVTVKRADRYSRIGPGSFELNPRQREHYLELFKELRGLGGLPDKIVHLWSIGPIDLEKSELELFDYYQDVGFYSLLYIAQAMVKLRITDRTQIGVVTDNLHSVTGEERTCPANATLLGACKSIPQEYPNIECRNIEIGFQEGDARSLERAANELLAELSEENPHPVVAYRGGQRWVQIFEPLRLEESPGSIPALRQGGVYLITGGLGGIGLALAECLANAVQARLVLLGRSRFPARHEWTEWLDTHNLDDETSGKIRRLQYIESQGCEILITSADVADASQLQSALGQVYAQFGVLHGVIHGAGNVSSSGFFAIDEAVHELCETQFRAKVRGLIVLEHALRNKDLDFVALLSSLSSVLAGLGYVAYSAANIYMDSVALLHNNIAGTPWISICWDSWDTREAPGAEDYSADLVIRRHEGVEAFRRIMASALVPQVVVSVGDLWARIDQWISLRTLRESSRRRQHYASRLHARPQLANPYIAPRNELEEAIVQTWQETLGVAQVGVADNFFTDLSGNSLLATQVVSQLRNRFQTQLPLRQFFDGPTVAELAELINSLRLKQPQAL